MGYQEMKDTDMTSQPFQPSPFFFLTSQNFPAFTRDVTSACYVTLSPQTRLVLTILEIRAPTSKSTCSRRLLVTDDVTQVSVCVRNTSSFLQEGDEYFIDNNAPSKKIVQIAISENQAPEDDGSIHSWIQLQSTRDLSVKYSCTI